jgi:hypothetical protein
MSSRCTTFSRKSWFSPIRTTHKRQYTKLYSLICQTNIICLSLLNSVPSTIWLRGATVARLTPDQKAACSNHVGVKVFLDSEINLLLYWKSKLKSCVTCSNHVGIIDHFYSHIFFTPKLLNLHVPIMTKWILFSSFFSNNQYFMWNHWNAEILVKIDSK